ncbi:methyltransferase domain-containing protein [Nocardioides sp. LS1]|uniref:methyltransferase domain-containing protein n=1 Tax=Nocardioides sp. LS1 TaxID=1027620 RepID=UPI000F6207E7|nr:methyltransferase domain-containing protein [Nocardioides sp. LS1]GCD90643.1 hypothetical protein NLS1_26490 [Nocardioides sp. LS1]
MTLGAFVKSRLRRAITRYSIRNRHRKAEMIASWMTAQDAKTILMVGALAAKDGSNVGIVEDRIMGLGEVKMGINLYHQDTPYPFMIADACAMPFPDDFVDFALSNAIIEHVGDEEAQRKFVAEHVRVSRCWVITTPNKWFPIESHTAVAFVHWLPSWRRKRGEFSRLLSLREFRALLPRDAVINGRPWSPTFTATYSR